MDDKLGLVNKFESPRSTTSSEFGWLWAGWCSARLTSLCARYRPDLAKYAS